MKNYIFYFSIIFVIVSCENNKKELIKLNNTIVYDINKFYNYNDNLLNLFGNNSPKELCLLQYDSLTDFLKMLLYKYDTLTFSGKNNNLIMYMQDFLGKYEKLIFYEYKQLLQIVAKPKYLFVAEDIIKYDSLYKIIEQKQQKLDKEFSEKQEKFLIQNKIQIEEMHPH